MPYSIARGKGCSPEKPWAVVKDTDGSVVACHESRESALRQIRALYAAEPALARTRARLTKADPKAPPKDRIKGSEANEEGSASGKRGDIEVSDATETALNNKADEHNTSMADKNRPEWTRVSVGALRSVYRRGSGAFSVSHRTGIGRSQWAMARVNAFLTLASTGKPTNPKYIGDNDLLHPDHPRASGGTARKQMYVQIDLWKHLGQQHDQSGNGDGTQFLPTVLWKHLAGKHDQRSHASNGRASTPNSENYLSSPFTAQMTDDGTFNVDEEGMLGFLTEQKSAHGKVTATEASAVVTYQSESYYEEINTGLRMEAALGEPIESAEIRDVIAKTDSAIAKSSFTEDVTVFRGVDDTEGNLQGLSKGDEFSDPAFQSTTLNPLVSVGFSGALDPSGATAPVTLRIRVPAGSPALAADVATAKHIAPDKKVQLSKDDAENQGFSFAAEVILPRWTAYRVDDVQMVDGSKVIDVTVVSNGR